MNNPRRPNVLALNRILPAIGIQADRLAQIDGTVADSKLSLLVPPVGWLSPAVSMTRMLTFALIEAGRDRPDANRIAAEMADTLLAGLPAERRPVMLDDAGAEMDVCASVADCSDALSAVGLRDAEVATVLGRLADEAASARLPGFRSTPREGATVAQPVRQARSRSFDPRPREGATSGMPANPFYRRQFRSTPP